MCNSRRPAEFSSALDSSHHVGGMGRMLLLLATKTPGVGHVVSENIGYFDEKTTDVKLVSASGIPLVCLRRFFR